MWTCRPCSRVNVAASLRVSNLRLAAGGGGGFGVTGRLNLDGLDPKLFGGLDLAQVRIEEERHFDARAGEAFHGLLDGFLVGDGIQPAFGGQFFTAFGHERCFVGFDVAGDIDDRIDGGHFQIEPLGYHLPKHVNVAVLNVPAVLAQMDRDAVGSGEHGQHGSGHGVGFIGLALAGRWRRDQC